MRSIFRTYYPRLCFFAESLTGNREEARDIAQEALLQCWRQRTQLIFQRKESLGAYLFTIVRRDCYDYQKHLRVKQVKQPAIIAQTQTAEEGIDTVMVYLEVLQKIYREIKNLPSPYAEIITLSFLEDLTTQEIAERLGLTPNNVRVHKSRALEKLRNVLLKQNLLPASLPSFFFLKFFISGCNEWLF